MPSTGPPLRSCRASRHRRTRRVLGAPAVASAAPLRRRPTLTREGGHRRPRSSCSGPSGPQRWRRPLATPASTSLTRAWTWTWCASGRQAAESAPACGVTDGDRSWSTGESVATRDRWAAWLHDQDRTTRRCRDSASEACRSGTCCTQRRALAGLHLTGMRYSSRAHDSPAPHWRSVQPRASWVLRRSPPPAFDWHTPVGRPQSELLCHQRVTLVKIAFAAENTLARYSGVLPGQTTFSGGAGTGNRTPDLLIRE